MYLTVTITTAMNLGWHMGTVQVGKVQPGPVPMKPVPIRVQVQTCTVLPVGFKQHCGYPQTCTVMLLFSYYFMNLPCFFLFSFFFGCDIVLFLYCTRLRSLIIIIFPMVGLRRRGAGDGTGKGHLETAASRGWAQGGGLEAVQGSRWSG